MKDLKYKKFFKSANSMGAKEILCEYLNISNELTIPFSISHGVDLNHQNIAMDSDLIEPIHWCYNKNIFKRASDIKSCILLPHPWLMLKEAVITNNKNNGALLIAPPGSIRNNKSLLKIINRMQISNLTILIKSRGEILEDKIFWESNGFNTISAGKSDSNFYRRLYEILSSHSYVIGCSMSSALIFASALGKKCSIMSDYYFNVYEINNYESKFNFKNSSAKSYIDYLLKDDQASAQAFARKILGSEIHFSKDKKRDEIFSLLKRNHKKVYIHEPRVVIKFIKLVLLLVFKRPSISRISLFISLKNIFFQNVYKVYKNDVDVFRNGINKDNFFFKQIRYKKEINRPGTGY